MSSTQYMSPIPSIDWLIILPILLAITTGIVSLIVEMFRPRGNNTPMILTTLIGLAASAAAVAVQFGMPEAETFGGMIKRDASSLAFQLMMVVSGFLIVLYSDAYLKQKRANFAEFYPLAAWSTAGGMMMVATDHFLMLFLGLEVLSIALYVMAGMARSESKSEESAIKYFLLGSFGSAFLLYGIAFVYGATGNLRLDGVVTAWTTGTEMTHTLLMFGLGLILVGLCFKAALAPFHQWTPDVYQGAPTNVTAFMASTSKISAIGALYRVLDGNIVLIDRWMPVLFWVAVLSMTVGNLVALRQTDVKRTLAYSSIANAGYMLVGILAHLRMPDQIGVSTTVTYLVCYVLMTIGAFAIVGLTARNGREGTRYSDLHGLWKQRPFAAGALVVFIASLIGVPPMAGFFAKFLIFQDALTAGMMPLAIVLAVNSAISVYYYLGIAMACFVSEEGETGEPARKFAPMTGGLKTATVICLAGIVGITFLLTPIRNLVTSPEGGSPVASRTP